MTLTKNTVKIIFIAFVLGALGGRAFADLVILKNGSQIEGQISEETDSGITLQFEGGSVDFSRSEIQTIEKKPLSEGFKLSAAERTTSKKREKNAVLSFLSGWGEKGKGFLPKSFTEGRSLASFVFTFLYYMILMFAVQFTVKKMGSQISLVAALVFPVVIYLVFFLFWFLLGMGVPMAVVIIGNLTGLLIPIRVLLILTTACKIVGLIIGLSIYFNISYQIARLSRLQALGLLGIMVVHFAGLIFVYRDSVLTFVTALP